MIRGDAIRKLAANIVFVLCLQISAQNRIGGDTVSLQFENAPLRTVLTEITQQSERKFVYKDNLISELNVSVDLLDFSLLDALNIVLNQFDLSFKVFDNSTLVLFKNTKTKQAPKKPIVVKESFEPAEPEGRWERAELLTKQKPKYPSGAITDNVEGSVAINLFINKSGIVEQIKIEQSSGFPVLDSAAADYSKHLRFIPAKYNGKPQSIWMSMTFRYLFTRNRDSLINFGI